MLNSKTLVDMWTPLPLCPTLRWSNPESEYELLLFGEAHVPGHDMVRPRRKAVCRTGVWVGVYSSIHPPPNGEAWGWYSMKVTTDTSQPFLNANRSHTRHRVCGVTYLYMLHRHSFDMFLLPNESLVYGYFGDFLYHRNWADGWINNGLWREKHTHTSINKYQGQGVMLCAHIWI